MNNDINSCQVANYEVVIQISKDVLITLLLHLKG